MFVVSQNGAKVLEMAPCNCGVEVALGGHWLLQWSTSCELCVGRLCFNAIDLRARVTGSPSTAFLDAFDHLCGDKRPILRTCNSVLVSYRR